MNTNKKEPPYTPELISVYEFAERKNVQPPAVYYRIKTTKEIEVIMIGKRKAIDWKKFGHIEFPNAERFKHSEQTETAPVV